MATSQIRQDTTHSSRARESHQFDARIREQGIAQSFVGGQQNGQHTGRQTGFFQNLGKHQGSHRRMRRRLQDETVTRRQCRGQLLAIEQQRCIERPDPSHHAQRTTNAHGNTPWQVRRHGFTPNIAGLTGGNTEGADDVIALEHGLAKDVTALFNQHTHDVVATAFHNVGRTAQNRFTFTGQHLAPDALCTFCTG